MKSKRRPIDPLEQNWMAMCRSVGCVLSDPWGSECRGPMTFQHPQGIRFRGLGFKGDYKKGFGLCTGHHLHGPNAIEEMGIKKWQRKYGIQEGHADTCVLRLKQAGLIPWE